MSAWTSPNHGSKAAYNRKLIPPHNDIMVTHETRPNNLPNIPRGIFDRTIADSLSHNANLRAHKPTNRPRPPLRNRYRPLQVQLARPPPPRCGRGGQLLLAKLDLAATTGLDVLQNQGTALRRTTRIDARVGCLKIGQMSQRNQFCIPQM